MFVYDVISFYIILYNNILGLLYITIKSRCLLQYKNNDTLENHDVVYWIYFSAMCIVLLCTIQNPNKKWSYLYAIWSNFYTYGHYLSRYIQKIVHEVIFLYNTFRKHKNTSGRKISGSLSVMWFNKTMKHNNMSI